MMTFIYNSVLLPELSCLAVESYKGRLHETSLNAQSFRFISLEKNKNANTLFFIRTKKWSVLRQSRWYFVAFRFSEVNVLKIYF